MYKIFNNIPDTTSCAYYRNLLPSIRMRDELRDFGIQVDTQVTYNPNMDYDCYIFSRIPNNPDVFPMIDGVIRRSRKKIIWDIDDELWTIPESNKAASYFTKEKIMWLNYYFNMSVRIISSTNNLAKSIEGIWRIDPSKIVVLENLIEEDSYKRFYRNYDDNSTIRILWTGSDSHEGDLDPINHLIDYYDDNHKIQFVFFGHMPDRFKGLPPHKIMFVPWANRKFYEGLLSYISPHIALIPLADNQFNTCKSAIKYYEMSMAGACCIASNVSPYADVIDHRVNGFLCSNSSDWISICDYLIENPEDRKSIAFLGTRNVIDNYSWDTDNKRRRDWFNFFKSIPDLELVK